MGRLTAGPSGSEWRLEPIDAAQARLLLRALADPIRLRVLESLGNRERCVCELMEELDLAQSKLSFHLGVLRRAGLLADRQQGRWIHYRVRREPLDALRGWLAAFPACDLPG